MDYETRRASFLAGIAKIAEDHRVKFYPNVIGATFEVETGKRYDRIVKVDGSSRSAYCFIDRTTGDVLKAAGWKAPAKGIRGNLFAEDNGLTRMGPYGPAYNK